MTEATKTIELIGLAERMLGLRDKRTACPARLAALFALERGRTMFRPTVHMRYQDYAWLRDRELIEGDTDSCLLTDAGASLQAALRAMEASNGQS